MGTKLLKIAISIARSSTANPSSPIENRAKEIRIPSETAARRITGKPCTAVK